MTLPSGAHVKIGSDEFMLAEAEQQHYVYSLSTLSGQRQNIPGSAGLELDPELIDWTYDDWSGGEGAEFYDPGRPTRYDHGGLNARMQGFVTNRPASTTQTKTATGTVLRVRLVPGAGVLWLSAGQSLWRSTDGLSFSAQSLSSVTGLGGGWTVRDLAGDQQYIYVFVHDQPNGVGAGRIIRINAAGTQEVFFADSPIHDAFGMAVSTGRVYLWTGIKLREYDSTSTSLPLTNASNGGSEAFYTGYEAPSSPNFPAYGGIVSSDTGIVFFAGNTGTGQVYLYADGVGRPLWQLPDGLTPRAICVQDGLCYVGGSVENRNTLYAMSMVTRQEVMIDQIRRHLDRQIIFISNGPASSIMFGGTGGNVYQYDSQLDAVTNLDVTAAWQQSASIDCSMYLNERIFVWGDDVVNTTVHITTYGNDETPATDLDVTPLYMPAWDLGYPENSKVIVGIEVLYKPLDPGQAIEVAYCLEENGIYPGWNQPMGGVWTVAGTITGPTAGDELVRRFITVSDDSATVAAYIARLRLRLTGAVRVYRMTLVGYVAEYVERWDLLLRVAQEDTDAGRRRTRPRSVQRQQEDIRRKLRTAVKGKTILTFLDGYPYSNADRGDYDTYHRCVLEQPMDDIRSLAEGVFAVRIRNLAR